MLRLALTCQALADAQDRARSSGNGNGARGLRNQQGYRQRQGGSDAPQQHHPRRPGRVPSLWASTEEGARSLSPALTDTPTNLAEFATKRP